MKIIPITQAVGGFIPGLFDSEGWGYAKNSGLVFNVNRKPFVKAENAEIVKTLFDRYSKPRLSPQGDTSLAKKPPFSPGNDQGICLENMQRRKNLAIEASPGSGKTTLAQFASWNKWGGTNTCYITFTVKSRCDLQEKIMPSRGNTVTTFHSLVLQGCRKAYGKVNVTDKKIFKTAVKLWPKDSLGELDWQKFEHVIFLEGAQKLVGLILNSNIDWNDGHKLAGLVSLYRNQICFYKHQGVFNWQEVEPYAAAIVADMLENTFFQSFDEILWRAANDRKVSAHLPKYSEIFLDECQDTNPTQIAVLKNMMTDGTQLVCVGEDKQAIYAFRGAGTHALKDLVEEFDLEVNQLAETRRYGQNICDFVNQKHGTNIRSLKKGGIVDDPNLTPSVPKSDGVICRRRSDCADITFALLRSGIPAIMVGDDISEIILTQGLRFAAGEEGTQDISKIINLLQNQEKSTEEKDDVGQVVSKILQESADLKDFVCKVHDITHNENAVEVSTGHAVKGREFKNAYIYSPPSTGFRTTIPETIMQPHEIVQEENLRFVADTRGMESINEIGGVEKVSA